MGRVSMKGFNHKMYTNSVCETCLNHNMYANNVCEICLSMNRSG